MNQPPAPAAAVTHTRLDTRLGELTIVARGVVVIALYFPHHWYRPDAARLGARSEVGFEDVRKQIHAYLAGQRRTFDVPVATTGDEGQERVWELVCRIPYGETASYGDLARQLGDGTTAQEVGAALGRNPVPLLVPCHRVVGAGGKLTGYGGGLDRKRFLLDLEARVSGRRLF
ncbi:MAG: methylated-DNA--[protein]-cysteine S-methyltransferase [Chloroflexi bacterium]|nr:methylated-DNA--[protein]-cysteine S-methyltransferase [Chloroflexota bacterium]